MEISLEQYEKIQDYLEGRMTPGVEKNFLIEIETNSFLKENFKFEKELRQNLASILDKKNIFEKESAYNEADNNFKDNDSIKNLIKKAAVEWEEENEKKVLTGADNIISANPHLQKTKVINLPSWINIAVAACIIVAIISLLWFIQKPSSPGLVKTNENPVLSKDSVNGISKTIPDDTIKNIKPPLQKVNYAALFKKYYAKDTATLVMPELLAMVSEKYKNGDYSFREINLNKIPLTRGSSNDINSRQNILQLGNYYQGLSYIETNDDKKAIQKLQWVIENAGNEKIKIKAQWYMALVYFKNNENKKAIPLLLSLSKNGTAGLYNKKARNILLEISKEP
jgi:hypothetical protein